MSLWQVTCQCFHPAGKQTAALAALRCCPPWYASLFAKRLSRQLELLFWHYLLSVGICYWWCWRCRLTAEDFGHCQITSWCRLQIEDLRWQSHSRRRYQCGLICKSFFCKLSHVQNATRISRSRRRARIATESNRSCFHLIRPPLVSITPSNRSSSWRWCLSACLLADTLHGSVLYPQIYIYKYLDTGLPFVYIAENDTVKLTSSAFTHAHACAPAKLVVYI